MQKENVWVLFACAAMKDEISAVHAATVADKMVQQWEYRFGDAAFLLEGQTECAACHKPLPKGSEFAASEDAVKFCNAYCLKASGR